MPRDPVVTSLVMAVWFEVQSEPEANKAPRKRLGGDALKTTAPDDGSTRWIAGNRSPNVRRRSACVT